MSTPIDFSSPAGVAAFLRRYNAWRQDQSDIDEAPVVEMPAPRDIGMALDAAVQMLEASDIHSQALQYIAWEAGSYAEAVQHAKEAIADTGAIPTPPCAGHAKQQEAEESAAPTYSYSTDGETFYGTFATPEEAAADYLKDTPDDASIEVGQNAQRTAHNYVGQYHIESLLEMVAESAYEECGDCAESWLSKMTADSGQIKELKQVVGDWIQRKEPPGFWHVDFIRRITRTELVAAGYLDQPAEAGGSIQGEPQ